MPSQPERLYQGKRGGGRERERKEREREGGRRGERGGERDGGRDRRREEGRERRRTGERERGERGGKREMEGGRERQKEEGGGGILSVLCDWCERLGYPWVGEQVDCTECTWSLGKTVVFINPLKKFPWP